MATELMGKRAGTVTLPNGDGNYYRCNVEPIFAGATTPVDAKLDPLAVATPAERERLAAADPPRLTTAPLEPKPLQEDMSGTASKCPRISSVGRWTPVPVRT